MRGTSISAAATSEDIDHVRRLFRAYAEWLKVGVCFQGFERELATLPGNYAAPRGRLLLARVDDTVAGTVALRPLEDDMCEMKRLWVEPAFLGRGLGRSLAVAAIEGGRAAGYRTLRLETIPDRMPAAQHLYGSLGFEAIPESSDNPGDGVVVLEVRL